MGRFDATDKLGEQLAERLPLLGLVLVPAARRTAVLWHEGPPDPVEVEELTALGRSHLAGDAAEAEAHHGIVAGFTMRDHGDVPSAVVLAVRRGAQAWTDEDRAILRAEFDLVRDELLAIAGRPWPEQQALTTPDLENRMRAAVREEELVLLYQPEVDLRSGRILAVEALLRWEHPELGRLEPQAFIPLAERSDLIKVLGTWVIDRALADFASWHDDRLVLRVNVSPAQLGGDGVVKHLARALADNGVPGSQVCVEFTETASQTDVLALSGTVGALSSLGVSTALDDLATGYSTLSRLRSLPVDAIKLDRSLVIGIDGDDRARAIVRSLLQLAEDLHLEVIAEGIENSAEADTLLALGCRRGQGHHFGRPQQASAIAELLEADAPLLAPRQA